MDGARKETINGKEYTVVKLQHQPKKNKTREDDYLDNAATVAFLYPQYTLKQIYEELPAYQVTAMLIAARKEQAHQLLLLNGIIHGPNAKKKEAYKKLIDYLSKLEKGEIKG